MSVGIQMANVIKRTLLVHADLINSLSPPLETLCKQEAKGCVYEIPVQERICSSLVVDCKHPPQKDHIMDWCVEVEVFFQNSRPSMKKEIVDAIKSEVEDRVH